MLRITVLLLMFLVVFLSGMLLGIDRGNGHSIDSVDSFIREEIVVEESSPQVEQEVIVTDQAVEVEAPVHVTQKAASLLEAGVSGFYELLVDILYYLSSLFF